MELKLKNPSHTRNLNEKSVYSKLNCSFHLYLGGEEEIMTCQDPFILRDKNEWMVGPMLRGWSHISRGPMLRGC